MFDLFIGKAPSTNRQMDPDPFPIQRQIRELLRIARNRPRDRRKNTEERRQRREPDVIVDISNRRERRISIDRRQKHEFLIKTPTPSERRGTAQSRRQADRDGVSVSLSTRKERRSFADRRELNGA